MSEGLATQAQPLTLQEPKPTRDAWKDPVHGCYPGTVVEGIQDPDKEGKVQIRVDQFYGAADEVEKIEDVDLPYARPGGFTAGLNGGAPWVPPVGAGVWVMFWGGRRAFPVWFGGYYGAADVPPEFSSAYSPNPKTRLVKTDNGHVIEMRWVEGQEEVIIRSAGGSILKLSDITGAEKVSITTPGDFEVLAQGKTTQSFALASVLSYLSTLTIAVTAALTVTAAAITLAATGVLTLTGSAIVIAAAAGTVGLGAAGVKQKLVNESFLTGIQIPNSTKYTAHTHMDSLGASTGGPLETPLGSPSIMSPGIPAVHSTVFTEAN